MTQPAQTQQDEARERVYARAQHVVYERLALASAVIWCLGTFILMATIVPYIEHPQLYIAIASLVPIIPATLPWLFYRQIVGEVARHMELDAQKGRPH